MLCEICRARTNRRLCSPCGDAITRLMSLATVEVVLSRSIRGIDKDKLLDSGDKDRQPKPEFANKAYTAAIGRL